MPDGIHAALVAFTSTLSLALKERDSYTRFHSDRVVGISTTLASHIQLTDREIKFLRTAAALHDIGKLGIPDSILLKPIKLDDVEFSIMKSHAEKGANLVLSVDYDGADIVAEAIRHHHENYNGSGYPDQLSGDNIPILSRIISIADNYDAMATKRVYQKAKNHSSILNIMSNESGNKHDPQLFESFIKVIDKSSFRVA